MARERKTSEVNKNMLEVPEGSKTVISGLAPGTGMAHDGIELEELGRLVDFPTMTQIDNPDEGTGEWCVVLSDFLSGATTDDQFIKGQVRRLSRLVPGYTGTDVEGKPVSKDLVKMRVKRLFDLGAIRLATREEHGKGQIEVTLESEGKTVQEERAKRIAAENELAVLREQLGIANDAAVAATPGTAGKSDAAQDEVGNENGDSGKSEDDEGWEA